MSADKKNAAASLAKENVAPTRFRCKVGGEWKPLDGFSNTQRKLVQRSIDGGYRVNAANSGMTCREHSAGCRNEIRCEVCRLIKPASEFSKTSKKNEENICKRCSAWGETQEPDVTPVPLETGHKSVEEDHREVKVDDYYISDNLFKNSTPQAPITGLASLGIDDSELSSESASAIKNWANDPKLLSRMLSGNPSDTTSQSDRSAATASSISVPPHLRAKVAPALPVRAEAKSKASESGPGTDSEYTSTQGDPKRSVTAPPHLRHRVPQPGQVPYNAWGPDGTQHAAVKTPTLPSSTAGESTAARSQQKGTKKGSKWAKPPRLRRSELPQYSDVVARHADPSAEDEQNMAFCDDSDSDY
ncbi:hypothetical protein CDD83_2525 [Cordyceps sp. RAO-2017]|nr:hypothetical protein CDD83_2525 [Cordyceps sp. RAO-2017]